MKWTDKSGADYAWPAAPKAPERASLASVFKDPYPPRVRFPLDEPRSATDDLFAPIVAAVLRDHEHFPGRLTLTYEREVTEDAIRFSATHRLTPDDTYRAAQYVMTRPEIRSIMRNEAERAAFLYRVLTNLVRRVAPQEEGA